MFIFWWFVQYSHPDITVPFSAFYVEKGDKKGMIFGENSAP